MWYTCDMTELKPKKVKTSFTLENRIKVLIVILSEKLSISQTAVVQMAIVKLAENENIDINRPQVHG
jgi:hypothetical protein